MGMLRVEGRCSYSFLDYNGELRDRKTGYFTNADAVENLIHYITRTRCGEDRANELKAFGVLGASAYSDIQQIVVQFQQVQKICRASTHRKMYHFTYTPDEKERSFIGDNYVLAAKIALAHASIFYNKGHQTVYAVHHDNGKKLHIHYAINSVNFYTGKMFHENKNDLMILQDLMTNISYRTIGEYCGLNCPIIHIDDRPDAPIIGAPGHR